MSRWPSYQERRWRGTAAGPRRVGDGRLPLSDVLNGTLVLVSRVASPRARQWLLLAGLLEGDQATVVSRGEGGDRVVAVDERRVFVPARVARETLVAPLER